MLKRAIPHLSIVLSVMLLVLYCIDGVNSAMGFLRGNVFKTLLLLSILMSILSGTILIAKNWRRKSKHKE
jgi:uncharacterized integral membrane protein